jgi:type IV pilus assembly protein PilA
LKGNLKEVDRLNIEKNKPITPILNGDIFKMRTELKAKFIKQIIHNQSEKGFTLVELLVIIIIIGILATIALPNFLGQTAKANQTEAKQNIGLVNRIQTVYRSENSSFAATFDVLATGTMSGGTSFQSKSYTYSLAAGQNSSQISVGSTDSSLKLYHGGTVRFVNTQSQSVIGGVICEANQPGSGSGVSLGTLNTSATTASSAISCASGYKIL